ncbi:MAG: homoprotocatechuate degradation operon regulator HpaR [Pikeienuella sp.]
MSENLRGFERSLPISLLRAREATMRLFKPYVDAEGLSLPQWRVIRALAEDGAADATALAEQCAILPPSLSRMIVSLSERGLLDVAREDGDGRRRLIRLTDEGARLFARVSPKSEAIYQKLEADFGEDRLKDLLNALDELRQTANELAAKQR